MRKNLLFFLMIVGIAGLVFTSCGEDDIEGCTDPQSNNYDAEATLDDGSCTYDRDAFLGSYLGSIVFAGQLAVINSDSIAFSIDPGVDPSDLTAVLVTFESSAIAGISVPATVSGNTILLDAMLSNIPITLMGFEGSFDMDVTGTFTLSGDTINGDMPITATEVNFGITVTDTGVLTATKQ